MRTDQAQRMTIGELAHQTGTTVKALREYTDLGLIFTLGRSPSNYRLYGTDALGCVRWIAQLRGLGLTVAEIRELTSTWPTGSGPPTRSRLAELLQRSRERLEQRIATQQQTLRRIEEFEAARRADPAPGDACPAGDPRRRSGA